MNAKLGMRRFLLAASVGFGFAGSIQVQAQEWLPVKDLDLEVPAGSLLDFSDKRAEQLAGSHGWAIRLDNGSIGFEDLRAPQRFFAASFAFSPSSGGFPDEDEAVRLVAQLKRTGYNAVRLQNVDANLMSGRVPDFDFDPVQLDRFDNFFAQLKAAGIYVVMDLMYLDNGSFGNIFPNRWVIKHNLREELYTNPTARAHWLHQAKALLARSNKYTGTVPIKDPALLELVLINEGGIVELAYRHGGGFDAPYPNHYATAFVQWLRKNYTSEAQLRAAWGTELGVDEGLDAGVKPPQSLRGADVRHRDFVKFLVDAEAELADWMTKQVRDLGFKGFTTAYNNWSSWQSDISRSQLPAIDMHAYHNLPSKFVEPGSVVLQTSALPGAARFVRHLAGARVWGKPFTVTEYGQPFWNGWRRESVALVPAYAALQGWDLLTQFAENPVQLGYAPSKLSRRSAIYPFGIGMDPVLRAGERLAALLYKRGDVATSKAHIAALLDPAQVLDAGNGLALMPESISRLSLLGGFGLQLSDASPSPAGKRYVVPVSGGAPAWKTAAENFATRLGMNGTDEQRVKSLKSAGLLPENNRTSFSAQTYQSDTGELLLQARERRFSVTSDRTLVMVAPAAPAAAGPLSLEATTVPVLVALSAMDGRPLPSSKRMLMFVLTDAQNSGMTFADAERTQLKSLGKLPVQILSVAMTLKWTGGRIEGLKLFALGLNGERREQVPLKATPDGWSLEMDTATLSAGPTTYFELAEE